MKGGLATHRPANASAVSKNKMRLISVFVFALSTGYVFVPHWSIAGLLVTDFFLRSFGMERYSFTNYVKKS